MRFGRITDKRTTIAQRHLVAARAPHYLRLCFLSLIWYLHYSFAALPLYHPTWLSARLSL
jgi:hypothetical protein